MALGIKTVRDDWGKNVSSSALVWGVGSASSWKTLQVTGSSLVGANYVRGQGGTWMHLEQRSMGSDTSGAGCQRKLSYLETSIPLPNTHIHDQPFLWPWGYRKNMKEEVMTKLFTFWSAIMLWPLTGKVMQLLEQQIGFSRMLAKKWPQELILSL